MRALFLSAFLISATSWAMTSISANLSSTIKEKTDILVTTYGKDEVTVDYIIKTKANISRYTMERLLDHYILIIKMESDLAQMDWERRLLISNKHNYDENEFTNLKVTLDHNIRILKRAINEQYTLHKTDKDSLLAELTQLQDKTGKIVVNGELKFHVDRLFSLIQLGLYAKAERKYLELYELKNRTLRELYDYVVDLDHLDELIKDLDVTKDDLLELNV